MMPSKVYVPENVAAIETFYGDLLYGYDRYDTISGHLRALASRMWEGVQHKREEVFSEISNYHWSHLGKSSALLAKELFREEDCLMAIANEFGFRRWSEVAHLDQGYDILFERAINKMLAGDLKELKGFIEEQPDLLNKKSDYGHKATLLHYAVCNGVELWRQRVPLNLPEIVSVLIEKGINTKAKMRVYNGEYTAAELLLSSAHPRKAGVLPELRKLLAV